MTFHYFFRNNPVISTETVSAFDQPLDKSKMVVFHAILPTSLWEWDSESEVYIRFGHPLENWKCDYGPMALEKYVHENIVSYLCLSYIMVILE